MELDKEALIADFAARVDKTTAAMLASASDASFDDLSTMNLTLLSTIFGTVRNVFERDLPKRTQRDVERQLIMICNAYLEAARSKPEPL